jgi:hypothetical protein
MTLALIISWVLCFGCVALSRKMAANEAGGVMPIGFLIPMGFSVIFFILGIALGAIKLYQLWRG